MTTARMPNPRDPREEHTNPAPTSGDEAAATGRDASTQGASITGPGGHVVDFPAARARRTPGTAADNTTGTNPGTDPGSTTDMTPDSRPGAWPGGRPGTGPDTVPVPPGIPGDAGADMPAGMEPGTEAGNVPGIPADTDPGNGPDDGPGREADTNPDTPTDTEPDADHDAPAEARTAREVIPSWMRSREAFTGWAQEWASLAARTVAFHTLRLPRYWAILVGRAPLGTWRVVRWTWEWATDINGRQVRRSVAYGTSMGAQEATAFHRVSEQHRERMRFRALLTSAIALVVLLLGRRAVTELPAWQNFALLATLLPVLGALYRDPAKPVISSFALADTNAPRLTTDLIVKALGSLGIAELNKALRECPEEVRFVAPGVHRDGPGWRADIDLPGGVTAGDIAERRDRLASGLRRPTACVWPEADHDAHAARMVLWVGDKPLHKTRPKPWPLIARGKVDLFEPFPIGHDQRGRGVSLTLMFASMVIGAVPRMGKTFALRLILLAASLDAWCELHIYDLKGGADLRMLGAVAHRFRIGEDDEDLAYLIEDLRHLKADMVRRYKVIRDLPESICPEGKVTPELAHRKDLGLHPIALAMDECQTIFEHPTFGAEAIEICEDLVKKGPAVGVHALLATQRPDAKSIPKGISANAVLRYCLKVTEQTANDMVLGTSMYKAGVRATMFARTDKGTGYLIGEGSDPQIVRFSYIDGPTAKTIALRARAMRLAAGTLSGHAAGLDLEPTDDAATVTVLDDLLHVIPATERRIWSETVIEHLAAYKPDAYAGWTPVDLGNALAPFGIETIQIGRRIDGKVVNRKGIDRTHLHASITERDKRRSL